MNLFYLLYKVISSNLLFLSILVEIIHEWLGRSKNNGIKLVVFKICQTPVDIYN